LKKRVFAHNNLNIGAKYTKARRPVKLVYSEKFKTKSRAMKREWEIKGMGRVQKLGLMVNI
jgi:putative endonuclease